MRSSRHSPRIWDRRSGRPPQKQFRKQPPKVAGWFFAWVQDGMTDEARAFLGSTVPAPVRMILSKVLGRGYHREIAPVWA